MSSTSHWERLDHVLHSVFKLVGKQMLLTCDSCSKGMFQESSLTRGNILNDDWRGLGRIGLQQDKVENVKGHQG